MNERAAALYQRHLQDVAERTDQLFVWLTVAQWLFAILVAVTVSPYAWEGAERSVHLHVWTAVLLGGVLASFPLALARLRPGAAVTRHVMAASQMLWSALLIHLTGGRIETHFHVFGSLAFVAFYRDWRVLMTATGVVVVDHFLRGMLWPESVYGVAATAWWRFLEHAGWVVFEDVVLVLACVRATTEMRAIAERQAQVEELSVRDREKSASLDLALAELRDSQEALLRTEKLAAVGQLAAGVGHELRNPLSAIRNAYTYVARRLPATEAAADPRVGQFLGIMGKELDVCAKIIGDLLDFARERAPAIQACPVRALVEEALRVVPPREGVTVKNEVQEDLPALRVDPDQMRQVLVNLAQNAVEAIPAGRSGEVVVRAVIAGDKAWLTVSDDGPGIPHDMREKIFQPLFTTKAKGTGLGLAIVASVVRRHGGTIRVDGDPTGGTTFVVELPVLVGPPAQPGAAGATS